MKDYHLHPCASKDCGIPVICIIKYNTEKFKECPMFDGTDLCLLCEEGNTPDLRS